MIFHQAFYGEVNRGHACIDQSLVNNELTSFLISFTDRPGALPPGVALEPYYSGTAWSNYYVFTKTFSDPFATRSGMVFTHALITKLENVKFIDNLGEIFSNFVDFVPEIRSELSDFDCNISQSTSNTFNKFQPKYIKECISKLLNNKLPILFSGDNQSFENVIHQIWNIPNVDLRKKIRYRSSFTPSDIEGIKELTIVSIQKEFISKWSDNLLISGENKEQIEITSPSESLFLGEKDNNPFYSFLVDLNVNQNDLASFSLYDKIYSDYIKIASIDDANVIRQDIRILSKVSPSMNDGIIVKNKFIDRLIELAKTGKERNFKALRNINWNAFKDGENKIRLIFSEFITKEFKSSHTDISGLSEMFELANNDEEKNWWHNTINNTIISVFSDYSTTIIENIWKLLNHSENIIEGVFQLIPNSIEFETKIRNCLPDIIKESVINKLENICRQRKWYLLHADILLKHLSPRDAIIKQISIETDLVIEKSIGVNYLIEKLDDKKLISLVLENCNKKLIYHTAIRISNKKEILKGIDVKVPCWLEIWSKTFDTTKNFSYGIEGRENEIAYSLLELVISGFSVPEIIIENLSKSEFANISEFEKRDKCWTLITPTFVELFIEKTSIAVFKKFIEDEIQYSSIEKPLVNHITTDKFITNFLSKNRNDIEPVIKVYESSPNLKDTFLADYIRYFNGTINDAAAFKLGSVVFRLNYRESAKSIYDKSKYNYSFNPAFEQCKSLVSISWWDSLWNPKHKESPYKSHIIKSEIEMIESLPTVVILTAIQEEYNAVRAHLIEIDDIVQNDTVYEAGILKIHDKSIAKVVIRECGAKNTVAAQETERAIQYFKPKVLLFVGIAGSRKPNDFSIGDVIFPKEIYSYEAGKSEKGAFMARPDLASSTYTLMELAKKERRKDDWKSLIKGNWDMDIKADLGIIASGEQIVEHYESEIGKILTKHYNDTSAVEMEGFGFAKVATRQGRETSNMLVGVIRGISDIIEQPTKNKGEEKLNRRPDNAKKLASNTAAAFAYWLIFKTYD